MRSLFQYRVELLLILEKYGNFKLNYLKNAKSSTKKYLKYLTALYVGSGVKESERFNLTKYRAHTFFIVCYSNIFAILLL